MKLFILTPCFLISALQQETNVLVPEIVANLPNFTTNFNTTLPNVTMIQSIEPVKDGTVIIIKSGPTDLAFLNATAAGCDGPETTRQCGNITGTFGYTANTTKWIVRKENDTESFYLELQSSPGVFLTREYGCNKMIVMLY
jgi:hypothetical protein